MNSCRKPPRNRTSYQMKLRSAPIKPCECLSKPPTPDFITDGMDYWKKFKLISSDGQQVMIHKLPFTSLTTQFAEVGNVELRVNMPYDVMMSIIDFSLTFKINLRSDNIISFLMPAKEICQNCFMFLTQLDLYQKLLSKMKVLFLLILFLILLRNVCTICAFKNHYHRNKE